MDGGEGAATLDDLLVKAKCELKEKKETWKCVLDGNSSNLATNIKRDRNIPKPPLPTSMSVKDCDKDTFPSQAHHLIPHTQLAKDPVKQFLKKGKKIFGDNNYSVNHGNNGKFMPYAAPLKEWDKAKGDQKQDVADELMSRVGIQLHQGPHSFTKYEGAEAAYKERVKEYLKMITNTALKHNTKENPCDDCGAGEDREKQPPRLNIVKAMDQASSLLEMDILAGDIFVSRRAAQFAHDYS
jgi:hypothetical protein